MNKFFKHKTESRGLERELYKISTETIEKIIKDLLNYDETLKNKLWIDPCAYDGRWQKVIEIFGIKCKSYDIEPSNNIVEKQDFYKMQPQENIFIIGNPPFSQIKSFIYKSFSLTDKCYFLGGSAVITGNELSNKCEMIHRFEGYEGNQKDKRSKLIFETTNNENILVWCCGGLFVKNFVNNIIEDDENGFAVAINKKKNIKDKRIRVISK